MDDAVQVLVAAKLKEKGVTMKEVSLQLGKAHSFLYQFLKRRLPAELRERERINLAAILEIPEDDLRHRPRPLPTSNPLPKRANGGSRPTHHLDRASDELHERCRGYEGVAEDHRRGAERQCGGDRQRGAAPICE